MDLNLTDEQRAIIEMADGLAARHDPGAISWEEAGTYPWEFMRVLAEHELTGIDIPESKGGRGLTLLDSVLVIAAVAARSPHLADAVQGSNFGAVRQIATFGNERVIEDVLTPILAGEALATVGMSEPGGGSALAALRASARRDGGDVVLNGEKLFNSNGPHATHIVAWVRFGEGPRGVGAVVVPVDTPGFSKGKTERFMSGEGHCTLSFEDCRVPAEYVLLEEDGIPYALIGAMALNAYGYERVTVDVDLLLTREGLESFKTRHLGLGYVQKFPGSKGFRDTENGVTVDVVLAGEYPGDGLPKPVVFPDPAQAAVRGERTALLPLPRLIELKLASGMTAPHRLKDLADVIEVIRILKLPAELVAELDPYVREKYEELWRAAQAAERE